MYSEHDRPSTQRMLITGAIIVAGIAALIGVAAVGFGLMAPRYSTQNNARPPVPSAQSPATATATASIAQAPAAPSPTVTTESVASAPKPAAKTPPKATSPAVVAPAPIQTGLGVVVIDAGHQGHGDSSLEPIGPGSATKRPKVESGASGVATHVDESQRNLEVALMLRKVLESRGIKVVMVRTTQSVNIANSRRAQIANDNHAALFVRLHCDSAGSSSVRGILTLRPAKNWYSGIDVVGPSAMAARDVQKAVLAATGAQDRGITPRSDLSGFNWSKVPAVLVEMGLMSNPAEDRKLGTSSYQAQLADGMANGIVTFLKSR